MKLGKDVVKLLSTMHQAKGEYVELDKDIEDCCDAIIEDLPELAVVKNKDGKTFKNVIMSDMREHGNMSVADYENTLIFFIEQTEEFKSGEDSKEDEGDDEI